MARATKTTFECTACGARSAKWLGRCTGCQGWNTLEEVREGRAAAVASAGRRQLPQPLGEVSAEQAERFPTGLAELDRVLGGGAVGGGVTLLGGDPGIGKSTLLMQALMRMAEAGRRVLYATGEESAAQVALRARRLGDADRVMLLATTELEDVRLAMESERYDAVVIDSIQTLRSAELESTPGSVGQLRDVTLRLSELGKARGAATFLIGHVTKDGAIAGPKVLEHLVDTVLSFEGDASHSFRIVRTHKNRFGPAHELGVFEMAPDGLHEVKNPSALFVEERTAPVAGSVVVATAEGSRPLLVEVQALVAPAQYGAPRRVVTGLDANRLGVLLAVLARKAGIAVLDQDVFASAAGGARVDEPAVDLALCAAVVSSLRDRPLADGATCFGEVGLAGELRAVTRAAVRVGEARKLGCRRVVLPAANAQRLTAEETRGVELAPAATLVDALEALFD